VFYSSHAPHIAAHEFDALCKLSLYDVFSAEASGTGPKSVITSLWHDHTCARQCGRCSRVPDLLVRAVSSCSTCWHSCQYTSTACLAPCVPVCREAALQFSEGHLPGGWLPVCQCQHHEGPQLAQTSGSVERLCRHGSHHMWASLTARKLP
jgi:hypothetical protein